MLGTKLILNQHIIYSGRATNAAAQAGFAYFWLRLLDARPISLLTLFRIAFHKLAYLIVVLFWKNRRKVQPFSLRSSVLLSESR